MKAVLALPGPNVALREALASGATVGQVKVNCSKREAFVSFATWNSCAKIILSTTKAKRREELVILSGCTGYPFVDLTLKEQRSHQVDFRQPSSAETLCSFLLPFFPLFFCYL